MRRLKTNKYRWGVDDLCDVHMNMDTGNKHDRIMRSGIFSGKMRHYNPDEMRWEYTDQVFPRDIWPSSYLNGDIVIKNPKP